MNPTRDLNFNGTISGKAFAQPLTSTWFSRLARVRLGDMPSGSPFFFDETDVAAPFYAGNSNMGKVIELRIQPQVLLKVMFGDMVPVHGR